MALNDTRSKEVRQIEKSILERGVTFPNSGLHILDSNATHDLIVKPGSNLTADRILTLTTGDAARSVTFSGDPTLSDWFDQSVKAAATPTFAGITLNNTGLHILDTNASHDLILAPGSNVTADRTLTITTGDSDRTVTFSGDPTLSDWFDQGVKTTSGPTFDSVTITTSATVASGVVNTDNNQMFYEGDAVSYDESPVYVN